MYKVIMSSEVYGSEEFEYDDKDAAIAGANRLKSDAAKLCDGVERHFEIVEV